MVRPLVSAIITTHNRAGLLAEALSSVYAQERRGELFELEVIVVDDASSDDTPAVVARFPATYLRHGVNRGAAAARNTGVEAGRGAYVAFLDDDDLWLPSKLRTQVPVLEAHADVGVVYSSFVLTQDGREKEWPVFGPSGDIFDQLLMGNFIAMMTTLVRRSALLQVGGFDVELASAEDYDFWLRLSHRVPFHFVRGPVAAVRPSLQGLGSSAVATGASRKVHRRIVARALALEPNLTPEAVQDVIDNMELRNAELLYIMPRAVALAQMLAHLGEYPRVIRHVGVREQLAALACQEAVDSPDPFHAAAAVCGAVAQAAGTTGEARRLASAVWTELALRLLRQRRVGLAVRAAWGGVRRDPVQFVGRGFDAVRHAAGLREVVRTAPRDFTRRLQRRATLPG
ncbi:MAG TPA: glycosyltransferase family A protein [bacterium]|nr:glycosyltransferase family A protein [bacterium]